MVKLIFGKFCGCVVFLIFVNVSGWLFIGVKILVVRMLDVGVIVIFVVFFVVNLVCNFLIILVCFFLVMVILNVKINNDKIVYVNGK